MSVWKKRNLTIFGKCMIINTLAISKLVYNASILQNPTAEFLKTVSKLIFNFLWKKRDRIKRKTLIGKLEKGGINIVDIESKFLAAKASWVKRITNKSSITYDIFNDMSLKMNISVYDVIKATNAEICKILKMPFFYQEVLSAFNICKKQKQPQSLKKDEILSEFIWCNSLFKFKANTLCFENWLKVGVLYVRDLFDQNGNMYDLSYFMNILTKKHNILCEYAMLKQAMKKYVKLYDFSNAHYVQISRKEVFLFKNNEQISVNFLKSGFYYSILVDTKFQNPLYESKWKSTFDLNSSDFNWENVYIAKIKQMYDNKIAEFNYKLLHCILNNNVAVSKWNKTVSPLCDICLVDEDIKHLLFKCNILRNIWQKIETFYVLESHGNI